MMIHLPHPVDQFLAYRQSESAAFFVLVVGLLDFAEQLEQRLLVFFADAGSVVGDANEHHVGGVNRVPNVKHSDLLFDQFVGQVKSGQLAVDARFPL